MEIKLGEEDTYKNMFWHSPGTTEMFHVIWAVLLVCSRWIALHLVRLFSSLSMRFGRANDGLSPAIVV